MTTVQLFGDIGLYSNYKQIINFTSVSAQNAWFNSKTKKTVSNVIYNKVYNSLKLNMSYGEAIQYSYVRLLDLDNTGRIYYNFVSAVNLIDDATVEFILEPDVIQTYMTSNKHLFQMLVQKLQAHLQLNVRQRGISRCPAT